MDLRSGMPFWLIKDGLPFNYPKLEKDLKTDVVIIGGGISGALCGYYFTKAGIECIVVDARTIGIGSTCASTSLLQYEIDTPLHQLIHLRGEKHAVKSYKLCEESVYKLKKLAEEIGLKDFELKNSFLFASFKKHKDFIEKEYEVRKRHGFKVIKLEQADIGIHFPFYAPAGILSECGAQTDAYMLTHLLHQSSIKRGLQVFDRTTITQFDHQAQKVSLKTAEGYSISAKKVIYATGYETINYIQEQLFKLHSTYVIISEQFSQDSFWGYNNCLIWETANPYLYLRTTTDNRIVVGGKDEPFYNPKHRDALLKQKAKLLERSFTAKFPFINFKTEFSWCGTFAATEDGLPFIDTYPKLPNSYFALGFGGNGITFSLIAAEIICDLLLKKQNSNAALFTFDR